MGNRFEYTIRGPQDDATDLPIRLSTSPSVRREPKFSGNNLRSLYQNPASSPKHHTSVSSIGNGAHTPVTPVLPPTPPNVEDDDGGNDELVSNPEAIKLRSMLATPVNQISPPTPDNTPPRDHSRLRPFLGAQPSMTSTRAESFKTALEDLGPDQESSSSLPISPVDSGHSPSLLPRLVLNSIHKPSPLARMSITNGDQSSKESSPNIPSSMTIPDLVEFEVPVIGDVYNDAGDASVQELSVDLNPSAVDRSPTPIKFSPVKEAAVKSQKENPRRGASLRERLEDAQKITHSPSVDKFASIIGWSSSVQDSLDDPKRWSGTSTTSKVEAILIEPSRMPRKGNTLRHVSKNDSLRSASSPLPYSNRASMQSSSESPHRLVHKKAKLSNHNRLSFGSEMSQPLSMEMSFVPKVEVIKVAVIPERSSSLRRSSSNSRRNSQSPSGAPTSFRMRNVSDGTPKKRSMTDTTDRGRDRHYPPQVPARGSSISAPTSRYTSRANSITSDHVRFERKRAEKDLRNTLEKMESEWLTSSLKSQTSNVDPPHPETIADAETQYLGLDFPVNHFAATIDPYLDHIIPGSKEWTELRPTLTLHTPFSEPSFMSASPEISEAKLISLYPHNNHSVQLIEPSPLQESLAVEEARKLNQRTHPIAENTNSPLRNRRKPPAPPRVRFVSSTPEDEVEVEVEQDDPIIERPLTPKRPTVNRGRTDSFKTLIRTVSLKNARNKKADQDLDSSQHPFWRPRPFWDGIEPVSPEKKRTAETEGRGIINNSLGLPQQRLVITGPLGLVRQISERRRNRKVVVKQSSYSSLQRLRTGQKLYRFPGFGMHLQVMSFRSIQNKVVATRQRKENEKREKRRELLRKSIGPNVVATGDSRFLAFVDSDTSLRR